MKPLDTFRQKRKPSLFLSVFLFVGVLSLSLFLIPAAALATEWYCDTGTGNNANPGTVGLPFKTITRALQALQAGDTIHIGPGTYNETITILSDSNNVAVLGDFNGGDSSNVIINAALNGDSTHASGMGYHFGAYIKEADGVVLKDLTFQNAYVGVRVENSTGSIVERIIANVNKYYGIYLTGSDDCRISGSRLFSIGRNGIVLAQQSDSVMVEKNVVSVDWWGIQIHQSDSGIIRGNVCQGNTVGIYIWDSDYLSILDNVASGGIQDGIVLYQGSESNTLSGNTVTLNARHGVYLHGANHNNINQSVITQNGVNGCYLYDADNNLIDNNLVRENQQHGVYVEGVVVGRSYRNKIVQNDILYNGTSGLYDGVRVWSVNKIHASADSITHNNIFGNSRYNVFNNDYVVDARYNYYGVTDSEVIADSLAGLISDSFAPFRFDWIDTAPTADSIAPEPPSNVSAFGIDDTSLFVSWDAPALDEDGSPLSGVVSGYRVYRTLNPAVFDTGDLHPEHLETTGTSFVDSGLSVGTLYYYVITAFDDHAPYENESWYSTMVVGAPVVFDSPLIVATADVTAPDTGVFLEWRLSDAGGTTGYNLYRALNNQPAEAQRINTGPITTNTYLDSNVVQGDSYYYWLTVAFFGGAESDSSNMATAPHFTISKNIINAADTAYFPGETITYSLHFVNDGFGPADTVVLYDSIPFFTNLFDTSLGGGIGFMWPFQYSAETNAVQTWESADYVNGFPADTAPVRWVRWRRENVSSGDSGTFIFSVILAYIHTATVIPNKSFLYSYNDTALTSETSSTVSFVVGQVASVLLAPAIQYDSVPAGADTEYRYDLTNTGNGPDTFLLNVNSAFYKFIYSDSNRNGVVDTEDTLITRVPDLAMFDSVSIILRISVPGTTLSGSTDTAVMTATPQGDTRLLSDTVYAVTHVGAGALLRIFLSNDTVFAGSQLYTTFVLYNVYGETAVTFNDTVALTVDSGNVFPAVPSFIAGVCTAGVIFTAADTRILTATISGISETAVVFVWPGSAYRFHLDAPLVVDQYVPFPLNIVAQDTFFNTVYYFSDSVSISDSTGAIAPTQAYAFANGETTVTVRIDLYQHDNWITVRHGSASGTFVIFVQPVDTGLLMLAEPQILSAETTLIRFELRLSNGTERRVDGETYVITLESPVDGPFVPNPVTAYSSGGSVTVLYRRGIEEMLRFSLAATILGENEISFERVYLQLVDTGTPYTTLAMRDGTQTLFKGSTFDSSYRMVVRPLGEDTPAIVAEANQALPSLLKTLHDPGLEYIPEKEILILNEQGQEQRQFSPSIMIIFPYPDQNQDGLVDVLNLKENTLRVYRLNEELKRWEVESSSTSNPSENYVRIMTDHLSFFTLLGTGGGLGGGGNVVTYPNPFYPLERGRVGGVTQTGIVTLDAGTNLTWIKVRIYNIMGDLVRVLDDSVEVIPASGTALWDGRNDRGHFVASGLYIYVFESSAGTATGKMTVIK